MIGKLGLRIDYDRYEVVRRKVLEAGGTPRALGQAQNATRFFSVRPRAADGTVAVAALRQATFDEAEVFVSSRRGRSGSRKGVTRGLSYAASLQKPASRRRPRSLRVTPEPTSSSIERKLKIVSCSTRQSTLLNSARRKSYKSTPWPLTA